MPFVIDAHEDLGFNYANYKRDIRRSAHETRLREVGSAAVEETGHTMLGWEDYQRGQVAMIFGTFFTVPARHNHIPTTKHVYKDPQDVRCYYQEQLDYYTRLSQASEDMFRLVRTQKELSSVLALWKTPAVFPDVTHPVGILMSIEGLEGIGQVAEIEKYWEQGIRAIGPVWAGGRFCGGTIEHGGFSPEGYELLKLMAHFGYILDLAHMTDLSARQALDAYDGIVIASHANARTLLGNASGERHLTDQAILSLVHRRGVMGVVPYNRFLKTDWKKEDGVDAIPLSMLADQIDYICQLTGSAEHVSFGTDLDGGFGYGSVPAGLETIADIQKLEPLLQQRGYSAEDIAAIFGKNWQRVLERALPV